MRLTIARFVPFLNFHRMAVASGLALLGLHGPAAWAEKADRDKPMQIEADALQHDENKHVTVFTGKVVALKGTIVMRAERMEVQKDKQGNQQAILTAAPGERVFFRQKREGLNEFIEGEAERAQYDEQSDVLTLLQRAEMRILRSQQQADIVQGQKIVYNNQTELMTVDGRPTPQAGGKEPRVRAVLTPRPKADEASTPGTPASPPALRNSPSLKGK